MDAREYDIHRRHATTSPLMVSHGCRDRLGNWTFCGDPYRRANPESSSDKPTWETESSLEITSVKGGPLFGGSLYKGC